MTLISFADEDDTEFKATSINLCKGEGVTDVSGEPFLQYHIFSMERRQCFKNPKSFVWSVGSSLEQGRLNR